ncbi:hypothetical protein GLOTRDRAFT_96237 [Gloeophyllum trabeum ATCC 11539]|uniref:C2H2-type domain-containing protein n=1 Tax=Gloeophyllum trabeum (strain ATCC 11539 / FP-39264 / Madison 617) TaxID=670483 RepID=S7RG41_GLOTA|nr:uncharacterized protein GLOTRDRAFT_96237 [Gloeophyllum trabeum ATCC 11539]EPQ51479.1 hypothetical protein GLOTRDRAFT_96237 [Gloeophyllum trabeum ATCC 11539]
MSATAGHPDPNVRPTRVISIAGLNVLVFACNRDAYVQDVSEFEVAPHRDSEVPEILTEARLPSGVFERNVHESLEERDNEESKVGVPESETDVGESEVVGDGEKHKDVSESDADVGESGIDGLDCEEGYQADVDARTPSESGPPPSDSAQTTSDPPTESSGWKLVKAKNNHNVPVLGVRPSSFPAKVEFPYATCAWHNCKRIIYVARPANLTAHLHATHGMSFAPVLGHQQHEHARCRWPACRQTAKLGNLLRHVWAHAHGPLPCAVCGGPFSRGDSLDRHMKQMHPEEFAALQTAKKRTRGTHSLEWEWVVPVVREDPESSEAPSEADSE